MMGRRRSSSGRPSAEWLTLCLTLIVAQAIGDTRGEYLMGGHLDNKENQPPPIQRRSDAEKPPGKPSSIPEVISSRTATSLDDFDSDFDLGLDLLAEQSSVDASRSSPSSSSSEDEKPESEEPGIAPRYRVPLVPYAFNGGQPFSLEKDPITGQIDFEKAPPLKALDYSPKSPEDADVNDEANDEADEISHHPDSKSPSDEGVGPNEINPYSPSFHDFLNLPVRYTYDRFENAEKYPLISSSYANTKVQSGANSYNTYNHKKYHESVKASVNAHLQPSRKSHVQPTTRSTTRGPPTETTARIVVTTTAPTTTTTTARATTTAATTTTTTEAPTTSTTTRRTTTFPAVTTWKPPRPVNKYSGADYEGTLPIERLQPLAAQQPSTSSEQPPPRYASPPARPSSPPKIASEDEEYEDEGYEDYDRVYQSGEKPMVSSEHGDAETDYSYGLDFFGVGSRPSMRPTTTSERIPTRASTILNLATSTVASVEFTTPRPTTAASTPRHPETKEDRPSTSPRPEEKQRVTSMPLDSGDRYVGNFGLGSASSAPIDNAIPSVTSNNVVYHQQSRPDHQYYARPSMGISAPGIVVKSTSNVIVPPGQDTVSFVLGNRQSVGGAGDAGGEYYPVHSGSIGGADRPGISFGSRPMDNYPGQMIVSAGIGMAGPPAGYNQRPQQPSPIGSPPFDHALVSVGLPTVGVVSPGDPQPGSDDPAESSTSSNSQEQQNRWPSARPQQNSPQQEPTNQHNPHGNNGNQFGYHVVFPDEQKKSPGASINEKPPGPVEEHVIVVHESEIGAGNTLHLELGAQSTTTAPTTGFFFETTTQRFTGQPDGLPELSESLTPPAERPNRVQQAHRPPNYNYYHHQSSHGSSGSRPNEYPRPQRVPLPPLPSSPSSSSSSGGFKRRPPPPLDSNLPNILPQFRPNAKVSHGHNRGDNVGTIPAGSLAHYPNTIIRRPPPPPPSHHHHHRPSASRRPAGPSHLQRLNPPPLPPPPPPISSLRLPTPAALVAPAPGASGQHDGQGNDLRLTAQKRFHQASPQIPPSLAIDERHQNSGFSQQQQQQIKSRLEDDLERFSAEPPQQPPRAPFFGKRSPNGAADQLPEGIPRIATLQMIQQHGGDDSLVKTNNLPPPYRFTLDNRPGVRHEENSAQEAADENPRVTEANRRGDEGERDEPLASVGLTNLPLALPLRDAADDTGAEYDAADAPVYVVYPVKGALDIRPTSHEDADAGAEDASVVVGKYGPQRPLPPDTLLKDTDDDTQEDRRHHHQGYRPATFSDSPGPQLASDFPYPLERPDPSIFTSQLREKPLLVPSEQRKKNEQQQQQEEQEKNDAEDSEEGQTSHDGDASVNVIPYPQDHIPLGLADHSGAISATLHRVAGFSSIVDSSSTPIAYVYTPTMRPAIRRPEDGYASFDRAPVLLQSQHVTTNSGPAAPQSFMAPFVASASAEAPAKNGWSVVRLEQTAGNEGMDRRRADANIQSDGNASEGGEDGKEGNSEDERRKEEEKKGEDAGNEETEAKKDEKETQTEKSDFNVENFTPQLFGGFKPIFEFPSDADTDPTLGDKVSGGALAIERPRSGAESEARKLENV